MPEEIVIAPASVHLAEFVAVQPYQCDRAAKQLLDNTVDTINYVPTYTRAMVAEGLACPWCTMHAPLRLVGPARPTV